MDKIIDILDSIAYEKGLKITDVENALKEALIKTAQKMVDFSLVFDSEIDKENKELKLFQKIEVVKNDDERLSGEVLDQYENPINAENFITIDEAKEIDEDLEIGDFVQYDLEFENMGRNAATILHNNFEYKIQRFIEENLLSKYQNKVGKIINGSVDTAVAYPAEIGHIDFIFTWLSFYWGVTICSVFYDEVDVIVEKGIIHSKRLKNLFFSKFSQTTTADILGDQ